MTAPSFAELPTPLGSMLAGATDQGIVLLEFADGPRAARGRGLLEHRLGGASLASRHPLIDALRVELDEFFGRRQTAFHVPIAPHGTEFQQRCWTWLRSVPYGETRTYGQAAMALGTSARAFARANAANVIAIVVPCHRIVGSTGDLVGYGGGLARKRELLTLER